MLKQKKDEEHDLFKEFPSMVEELYDYKPNPTDPLSFTGKLMKDPINGNYWRSYDPDEERMNLLPQKTFGDYEDGTQKSESDT